MRGDAAHEWGTRRRMGHPLFVGDQDFKNLGWATRREFSQLSLGDLSPLTPVPQGHLLVVLKSYFDGGNKADSPEYSHACIAVVSGSEKQWKRFNTDWK